jgi:hypothetical protein
LRIENGPSLERWAVFLLGALRRLRIRDQPVHFAPVFLAPVFLAPVFFTPVFKVCLIFSAEQRLL